MKKTVTKTYRSAGDIRLHVARALHALGRPLPRGAVVHHADGSRLDDAPLVICQNETYHRLLHVLLRVRLAGGDPWRQRICVTCHRLQTFEQLSGRARAGSGGGRRCHACNRQHVKEGRAKRRIQRLAV